jgi:hypothetical protein
VPGGSTIVPAPPNVRQLATYTERLAPPELSIREHGAVGSPMKNPYLNASGNPALTFRLAFAVRTIWLPPVGFATLPVPVNDQVLVPVSKLPVQLTSPPGNDLSPPLSINEPAPASALAAMGAEVLAAYRQFVNAYVIEQKKHGRFERPAANEPRQSA